MQNLKNFIQTLVEIVSNNKQPLDHKHMLASLADEPPFLSIAKFFLNGGFLSRTFGVILVLALYFTFFLFRILAYPTLIFIRTVFGVGIAPTYFGRVFENILNFIFWAIIFIFVVSTGAYNWTQPIIMKWLE